MVQEISTLLENSEYTDKTYKPFMWNIYIYIIRDNILSSYEMMPSNHLKITEMFFLIFKMNVYCTLLTTMSCYTSLCTWHRHAIQCSNKKDKTEFQRIISQLCLHCVRIRFILMKPGT